MSDEAPRGSLCGTPAGRTAASMEVGSDRLLGAGLAWSYSVALPEAGAGRAAMIARAQSKIRAEAHVRTTVIM